MNDPEYSRVGRRMQSSRFAIVAVVVACALWAQLAVIPLAVAASHGTGLDLPGAAVAGLSLVLALAAPWLARRRPALGVGALLAGFPVGLGAFGLVVARNPMARFDVPARLIAAATAVGFVVSALAWAQGFAPRLAVTVAPSEPVNRRAPAPPLARAALVTLAAMAVGIALIAPAVLASHGPASRAERLGGEAMIRAREALTAAGGLAIAVAMVLVAGGALVRGRASRRRRDTRALAYLVWGLALAGLLALLERAR